ncbi:MAG: hypothetical protein HYZ14_02125 [Bacteroidetes bacterium]|nr:hypothetical protein [Bacteroidota bacterium]
MSFQLSKEEFSLYSLNTRLDFTRRFGTFVGKRFLVSGFYTSLYKINDFYVEVLYDVRTSRQVEVSLVVRETRLRFYQHRRGYD